MLVEMPGRRHKAAWISAGIVLSILVVTFLVIRHRRRQPLTITGAVTINDGDFRKELPISDVEVSVGNGASDNVTKTDASGFFSLTLRKWVRKGSPITLKFRHPNYQPLNLKDTADTKLYIAHLVPMVKKPTNVPTTAIGNIRIRYLTKGLKTVNVGSAAKTFEVLNVGNVPCGQQPPCSPDGKWKASIGSLSLDAGPGNEFHDTRVSCIAGPCPFTRIESEDISRPSQKITAWASSWSDNAVFLVEAEVVHVMQNVIDHTSYPVIFGSAMSFTLPSDAEGVTLEADYGGQTIIYPLGPKLLLSWATCEAKPRERTNTYRCELKPGFRFQ